MRWSTTACSAAQCPRPGAGGIVDCLVLAVDPVGQAAQFASHASERNQAAEEDSSEQVGCSDGDNCDDGPHSVSPCPFGALGCTLTSR